MKKPQSNPYIGKLEPIMTKYLNGRFGPWEGVRRWERTVVKGDEECDYWIVGSKTAEEIQKKG